MGKVFVGIIAEHTVEGNVVPRSIIWNGGELFSIDKVVDVRRAACRSGGQGLRYTCRMRCKEVYLFCDEGRWFIEV